MTLETEVSELTTTVQSLVDIYQEKAEDIDQSVQGALAAVPENKKTFYVDQANGSDTANGNTDNPLKSIGEAIERTPVGGLCVVNLLGNYHTDKVLYVTCNLFVLGPSVDEKPTISFGTYEGDVYIRAYGFIPMGPYAIAFRCVHIELLDASVNVNGRTEPESTLAVVRHYSEHLHPFVNVHLSYSTIYRPANCIQKFFGPNEAVVLTTSMIEETGEPMLGHWIRDVNDEAGTDPVTLIKVLTDMPRI